MIDTSQDYKNEIQDLKGRKTYGRVEIDYTDPFLDQSIEVSANENASVSYPDQVKDNLLETYGKIASLDGSWILDGSWVSAPVTPFEGQMGWWGEKIAVPYAGLGAFTSPYPTLTVTFLERPIQQLKVVGDSSRGEYPVDFKVRLYDSGDTLILTETVTNNTDVHYVYRYEEAYTGVAKMTLEITKWSHAGRQAKITEFITSIQEVYEGDEIISINLLEEKEVSTSTGLPIGNISSNEITVKLANTNKKFDPNNSESPLYQLLKPNRRIRAWVGTEAELLPLGRFWSGDWEIPEHEMYVSVTGNDKLHLLSQSIYSTSVLKQDVTLYELAVDVFTDAGMSVEEYSISDELLNYVVPFAYFNPVPHREALRQIAVACAGQVYCDRYGVIRVGTLSDGEPLIYPELTVDDLLYLWQEDLDNNIDFELIDGDLYLTATQMLTKDNYYKKNSPVKWSQIANVIEMDVETKKLDISQEIFNAGMDPVQPGVPTEVQITYDKAPATDLSISVYPISLLDAKLYSWGAVVTVVQTGSTPSAFQIKVTGKPLIDAGKQKIVRQDQASILDHGKVSYVVPENPFFQSLAFGEQLCDKLLDYYKNPQKDVDVDWRGDPSWELGDTVIVADDYATQPYTIISQEIDFDGALRSRLKARDA